MLEKQDAQGHGNLSNPFMMETLKVEPRLFERNIRETIEIQYYHISRKNERKDGGRTLKESYHHVSPTLAFLQLQVSLYIPGLLFLGSFILFLVQKLVQYY